MTALLSIAAAEAEGVAVQASGWFLENVFIIPLIMAISFVGVLFFGKRLPKGGSELGILAVGLCFVLALITAGQWIGQVNGAEDTAKKQGLLEKVDKEDGDHSDEEAFASLSSGSGELASGANLAAAGGEGEVAAESAAEAGEEGSVEVGVLPVISTTTWWSNGGIDFSVGTMVDGLTVALLVVVTLISLLVHIYSTDYVAGDRRFTHYFAFLSLFTAAMLFFVTSENILQMIVGWELVGVCSFALIGHWWEDQDNSDAALKAFLTNRVGDMGLLIGMIVLFFAAGETWSVFEINKLANSGGISHNLLLIVSLCLIAAVMSKSGQFMLHTWLPDAMAGPTPVSALIHAATMVVAGIYMIARLYGVFFNGLTISGSSLNMLALVGGITTLVGASMAFVQDDIKKVLAYSTISQLGYMSMALGVGAWTAGVFHLFTHALFKACLFLGAGSVAHSVHSFDMKKDMGGMKKWMPQTYATFLIGSIALAGLPPLAGFWSKDEILVGTGGWGLFGGTGGNGAYTAMLVMGIITAALTAAYMTRVIYLTFHGEFRGHGHPHESGKRITIPLWILAGLACVAGLTNLPKGFQFVPKSWQLRFEHFVEPLPNTGYFPAIAHGTPSWSLAIVSTLVVAGSVLVAYYYYFVRVPAQSPTATELINGPTSRNSMLRGGHQILKNRYYLDHIYQGGEPVSSGMTSFMALAFGSAAGLGLGFTLRNGLDLSWMSSLVPAALVGAGVMGVVGATLSSGVGIADFTKRPLAWAANWFNQNVLDRTVNEVGIRSVQAADVVYKRIDQGVIDGAVNATGIGSQGAGGELRRMQTGKVQQYATIMFAAATIIAGLFIVFI